MSGQQQRREYRVTTRDKDLKIIHSVPYTDSAAALVQFHRSLRGAGRNQSQANQQLLAWTAVLMEGGTAFSVANLDPASGTVDITVRVGP